MASEPNGSCNKGFADSYMLLNPNDARFFDLLHVLYSRNLGNRKFVDSKAEGDYEGSFRHRWLIFVSVVLQKLLLLVAKPLALFGSFMEFLLNLVYLNGGFIMIVVNFLTGNLIQCIFHRSEANFFFLFYTFWCFGFLTQLNWLPHRSDPFPSSTVLCKAKTPTIVSSFFPLWNFFEEICIHLSFFVVSERVS